MRPVSNKKQEVAREAKDSVTSAAAGKKRSNRKTFGGDASDIELHADEGETPVDASTSQGPEDRDLGRDRRTRKQNLERTLDMYRLLDGSALMAMGTFVSSL